MTTAPINSAKGAPDNCLSTDSNINSSVSAEANGNVGAGHLCNGKCDESCNCKPKKKKEVKIPSCILVPTACDDCGYCIKPSKKDS